MHYEGFVVPSCRQQWRQCPAFHWKRSDRLPDVRSLRPVFLIAGRPGVAPQHCRPANPCFPHFFHTAAHGETARNASGQEKAPQINDLRGLFWWAVQGSNLRPLPCEGRIRGHP